MAKTPKAGSSDAIIQQLIASQLGQGASGASKKPPVYMGSRSGIRTGDAAAGLLGALSVGGAAAAQAAAGPEIVDYDTALGAPARWSQDTLKQFVNSGLLNKVPGFDSNMGMPEVLNAWGRLVDASTLYNQGAGRAAWTPWDVLHSYANNQGKFGTVTKGDWQYDVATGERVKYVGKTTKTTKRKQFDISSPKDVQILATQTLRELLGRAPTEKEMATFKASINGYEKEHPTEITTTQKLAPDVATGQLNVTDETTTTKGGVTDAARAALVQDPTVKSKEYGKYQAATTYYDAMMQMIGGG